MTLLIARHLRGQLACHAEIAFGGGAQLLFGKGMLLRERRDEIANAPHGVEKEKEAESKGQQAGEEESDPPPDAGQHEKGDQDGKKGEEQELAQMQRGEGEEGAEEAGKGSGEGFGRGGKGGEEPDGEKQRKGGGREGCRNDQRFFHRTGHSSSSSGGAISTRTRVTRWPSVSSTVTVRFL